MQLRYKTGYKYQVQRDWAVKTSIIPKKDINVDYLCMGMTGILRIKRGYAWDGPSGPTLDTDSAMKASLAHDALYQLIRDHYLTSADRKAADELLRDICIDEGMWKPRAWVWYYSVRSAGKKSSTKETRKLRIIQ